jgi:predicted Zn-dependent protease
MTFSARWLLLGLVAAAAALPACSTNKTTGRLQFNNMNRDEEIKLGSEAAPQLTEEFGGKVPDPALQQYVTDMGKRLADTTGVEDPSLPTLPWEFTLLNSGVINAFALPGGKVFISRALAEQMTDEAQMAAVLGHEIGHVTAEHADERMGQQLGLVLGGTILGAVVGGVAGGDTQSAGIGAAAGGTVGGVAALSYSRGQEVEADRLGMRYMERIKYDPSAALDVQDILRREAEKGGGRPPEILSTHPSSDTRIKELRKRLDKYYQHTVNNPEYVRNAERYQSQFLSRLTQLPPPPKGSAMGEQDRPRLLAASFFADPANWCGHCAAARGRAEAAHP